MKYGNNPMQLQVAPRCGAKTRSGTPCHAPAIQGKRRCRMHGGKSPGAPKGNQNAFKHGRYTTQSLSLKREAKQIRNVLVHLLDQASG